jgi:hypothetical protein
MLQADPFIQAPKNSQSYNRYSYVLNNPLSHTDPSGYFFKALGKFIKKYWRPILAAVAAVVTYGAPTGWAASLGLTNSITMTVLGTTQTFVTGLSLGGYAFAGAVTGFVSGAIGSGSLKGALRGAFSGAVFGGLGYGQHAQGWGTATQLGTHALAGGILSDLQGGKFGHGFLSAGVMKGFGKINFDDVNVVGRTIMQAMVGGTVSRLTGGKFANGAVTPAIQFVVNEKSSWIRDRWEDLKSIGRDLRSFFYASELDLAFAAGYGLKVNSPTGAKVNAQAKIAAGVRYTDNQAENGLVLKGALALETEVPFAKVGFGSIEGEGLFLPEKGYGYWKDLTIKGPKWELHDVSFPEINVLEASLTIQPVNVTYKFNRSKFERLRNDG